jgi:hypothetical protein
MYREFIICAGLIVLLAVLGKLAPPPLTRPWQIFLRGLSTVSQRKTVSWVGLGLLVLVVRAALLPVWPIPKPSVYDEFSYILQADTFSHGRLSNPAHPLWRFFESTYILQQPTYGSRFPPGQGLAMAVGQVLLGHPWFGVWLSAGILAATLCWALQGWLPPHWALLGACLALPLCLVSYWMNSYWGGAVTAIGGALVVGAWIRITRAKHENYAWHLAIGGVVLVLARPFEGSVLLITALIALMWLNRSRRVWLPIALVGMAGASWLAYDNYRVTGHALRMPYRQYYTQYETVPPFWFMPLSTPPGNFRPFDLRERTLETYKQVQGWRVVVDRAKAWPGVLRVYYGNGIWLLPLAGSALLLLFSRKLRFVVVLIAVVTAVSLTEVWWYPHYAAAFTAAFFILIVQSIRYLCQWSVRGWEVGRVLTREMLVSVMLMTLVSHAQAIAMHRPALQSMYGMNSRRGDMERRLREQLPGHHVVIVRYSGPSPHYEWVYNPAEIDSAPVVWAQDLGKEENQRLLRYYAGRRFWLFEPNELMRVSPYSGE